MRMKNLEKYRIGGHLLEREIGHPDPRPGAHRKVVPIAILRGIFNVTARPAHQGRNPQTGETIQIAACKAVRFHAGKAVKDALNPPNPKVASRKKTPPTKKSAARK
jgi:hypothetical protein